MAPKYEITLKIPSHILELMGEQGLAAGEWDLELLISRFLGNQKAIKC